ncbi:MAG: class A beta-lactamase [Caulobacterales bacterium]
MRDLTRRGVVVGAGALAAGCAVGRAVSEVADPTRVAVSALEQLEAQAGGRLGVCVLDTGGDQAFGLRVDERFGMCSTFKMALAGLILADCDAGRLDIEQRVGFSQADMVPMAPVAEASLIDGFLTVGHMAEAVQTTSDNVCANLLLRMIGGPEGFTQRVRALGDDVTRLDRYEPGANLVPPGEVRDTTSPVAHAYLMRRFLVGDALYNDSRATLIQWMVDTQTGLRRLRAGFPEGWRAGDKTGTGLHESMPNKTNDIAIVWPPNRAPVIVTAYLETPYVDRIRDEDQAVLARVGAIVGDWVKAG